MANDLARLSVGREFGTILRVGQVRRRDWRDSEHSGFDRANRHKGFAAVCNYQDSGPSFDLRSFSAGDGWEFDTASRFVKTGAEVRAARRNDPTPVMDYRQLTRGCNSCERLEPEFSCCWELAHSA